LQHVYSCDKREDLHLPISMVHHLPMSRSLPLSAALEPGGSNFESDALEAIELWILTAFSGILIAEGVATPRCDRDTVIRT
jgi:hypothetical protein